MPNSFHEHVSVVSFINLIDHVYNVVRKYFPHYIKFNTHLKSKGNWSVIKLTPVENIIDISKLLHAQNIKWA